MIGRREGLRPKFKVAEEGLWPKSKVVGEEHERPKSHAASLGRSDVSSEDFLELRPTIGRVNDLRLKLGRGEN